MPEKYVSIDGIPTLLRHTGPTTLPDVPPDLSRGEIVLCLHAAGWTSSSFERLLEALAPEHSPIAFDLPAHGRSGGLDALPSVEHMADHARALAGKIAPRPAVLVGHSMGGAVAIEYALRHPEEVRALVLCCASVAPSVDPERLDRVRRVTEGKERRFFLRELYSPSAPREVLGAGFAEDMKTDPRALYGDLRALGAWDAETRLAEIAAPALVLSGEDEPPRARAQAELLASRIPNARGETIAEAGHFPPIEQPEAFAAAVSAFLRELPR